MTKFHYLLAVPHKRERGSGRGTPQAARRRRVGFRIGVTALFMLVLLTCAGALLAIQVKSVRADMQQTLDLVPVLRSQIVERNTYDAQGTLGQIQDLVSSSHNVVTGPLWKIASALPYLGESFSAVTEVLVSAQDVAHSAAPPVLDGYKSLTLDSIAPIDGQVDTSALESIAPSVRNAAEIVKLSADRLEAIDLGPLIPAVAEPVKNASEQLRALSTTLDIAASTTSLLPVMLGADEARTYLILIQNNAEVRATGGIPGALTTVSADHGHIALGEQTSAGSLGTFHPPLEVSDEQELLYTSRLGRQMQNVNLTPDFPTAAVTARGMWQERYEDTEIDGVIGLDPVVLSLLLEATGPVELADPDVLRFVQATNLPTSLTAENVIPTLLSDVYREIADPGLQDAYFAAVAAEIFSAFTNGQAQNGQVIKAILTGVQEGRLKVWSSKPAEQEIISATELGGAVTGSVVGGTAFGVYFNDGTGAKMDYYAIRTVQLLRSCPAGGYNSYTVRMSVTNNAPADAGSTLPDYVTGGGIFGVEPGRLRTNHVVYGPSLSFVETAKVNGETTPIGVGKHGQRPVGTVTLELGPGETAVLDVTFSRVVQDSEPRLLVTPTIASLENVVLPLASETSCG